MRKLFANILTISFSLFTIGFLLQVEELPNQHRIIKVDPLHFIEELPNQHVLHLEN